MPPSLGVITRLEVRRAARTRASRDLARGSTERFRAAATLRVSARLEGRFVPITGGWQWRSGRSPRRVLLLLALGVAPLTGCEGNESVDVANAPYEHGVEVGQEYAYELTTHCGMQWARIGGAGWQTEPLNDGNSNPPSGWDNPVERETLKIDSVNTAQLRRWPR